MDAQIFGYVASHSRHNTLYRGMAKKTGKKKTNSKAGGGLSSAGGIGDGAGVMVDPAMVRYQHARIRPFFSGCGRRVEDTLNEIRQGKMKASDLPPIQVLLGPIDDETGEPWYFSLNNRRLWVLKRCREEGLLPDNRIYVRVRKPKSEQEALRYSIDNCVLEAKFMPEKLQGNISEDNEDTSEHIEKDVSGIKLNRVEPSQNQDMSDTLLGNNTEASGNETESEESEDEQAPTLNRFSALF